jgi:SsrA-binding protein
VGPRSSRCGGRNLTDAFATVDGERGLVAQRPYPGVQPRTWTNHTGLGRARCLLNRREIARIERDLAGAGTYVGPAGSVLLRRLRQVEIALATGKREYDKRQTIAARESKREAERALAARNRGE